MLAWWWPYKVKTFSYIKEYKSLVVSTVLFVLLCQLCYLFCFIYQIMTHNGMYNITIYCTNFTALMWVKCDM